MGRNLRALAWLQGAAAVAPLASCAILPALARMPAPAGQATLFAAAFLCGAMGGFQFPIASRVFFREARRGVGGLYALDLAGSCVGALLFSAYLIPVVGFVRTALVAAAINLGPVATALHAARSEAGSPTTGR